LPYNNQCKTGQLVQKFVPQSRVGIFRNERTRSIPWTLNFCFRAICTILVHLGLFGCLTKLGAERAELLQKFIPRSYIGIFRDESIRSNPLESKLTFWCVSYYLGAFGTLWLPYNTQCKTGQTVAKVRATKYRWNFSNEHPRSTPLDPKLIFWCVSIIWVHLGLFGCVTTLTVKRVKLVKNFVP